MIILSMIKSNEEEKNKIRAILPSEEIIFYFDLDENQQQTVLKKAEIIVGGKIDDEKLKQTENLKLHQTFATGVDRHNLALYKEKGIILCNSHYHSPTIAEYGFALLVAASKELIGNDRLLRKGLWNPYDLPSVTLYNKTICFLGYGHIAKWVRKMLEPFSMKILTIKRTEKCEDVDVEVYNPENKLQALAKADFIFNSLPLNSKTKDFLGEEEFKVMKKSAILVNVGRGETINEQALYTALKENMIKGAAIDVWYNYPKTRTTTDQENNICHPSQYPFNELDNIIMSAHRAWVTDTPWFDNTTKLFENVKRFISSEEVENIVNLDEGY